MTSWALRITDQGRMEGRTGGRLRHSLSPPVPSSVTRTLTQEALGLHYPGAVHQPPQSLCWVSSTPYPTTVTTYPSALSTHGTWTRALQTSLSNLSLSVMDSRVAAWLCPRGLTVLLCLKSALIRLNKRNTESAFYSWTQRFVSLL